jgi:hypothetical protein
MVRRRSRFGFFEQQDISGSSSRDGQVASGTNPADHTFRFARYWSGSLRLRNVPTLRQPPKPESFSLLIGPAAFHEQPKVFFYVADDKSEDRKIRII